MSYYPIRESVEKIIKGHNSVFSEAEICVIGAMFKWLKGDSVDSELVRLLEQLVDLNPDEISEEDEVAIIKLVKSILPD